MPQIPPFQDGKYAALQVGLGCVDDAIAVDHRRLSLLSMVFACPSAEKKNFPT